MPDLTGFGALADVPEERINDKITRKVVSGKQGMLVWWSMKAGAHAQAHKHPHEQIAWVIKGRCKARVGSETRECKAGDVVVIPGGIEHEFMFAEDAEVLDLFSPPREDFLAGGPPAYMKA
jgi:unsaturated pyranuronate lyase